MSDPNSSSLNLSSESIDVKGGAVTVHSSRSRSSSGTPKSGGRSSRTKHVSTVNQPQKFSQVIKRLPKPSDNERAMLPVPLAHSSASASQPSTFIPQEPSGQPDARMHHSHTVQYHDHRTQQVNVGVDPMDFANMVSEAKRVVQEYDERIKGLECLAQDVYSQACSHIQELIGVVESLQLSNQGFQNQIHQLNSELANVRAQLELQITRNHDLGSRVECSASMLIHKEGNISRLMDEMHQLKDSVDSQRLVLEESQTQNLSLRQRCQDMEMSLAARSAAQPIDQVRSDAPPPPAFSAQLLSMMEASQDLSTRMSAVEDAQEIHVDQIQSHNSAAVSFPFPPSGLPPRPRFCPALAGSGGPGFPSNDGGDGFDDEVEELIRDRMPQNFTSHRDLVERDIVDDRLLRYATLGPVPSSASDFRVWKSQLLLIMAKLDVSDRDYLAHSKTYEVNSDEVIKHDSGCVPRLDRWLAPEISKGCEMCLTCSSRSWGTLKDALELETLPAPRGRYLLHIVSRHFDIDRTRGSLLTSQSIFQIGLDGYSAKHLQKFSGRVLRTLKSVPRKIGRLSA